MLSIRNIDAWYGRSHILQDVSLSVDQGEVVTIVGRNGAGKTTTLKSIRGLIPSCTGSIKFEGRSILELSPHERFHLGLAYVPENRSIVPGLTVLENIRLGTVAIRHKPRERDVLDRIETTFPRLIQRLDQEAVTLSGGEQQMLAIARAMAASPKMIMLDEPSEGIMPILVDEIFSLFVRMKAEGTTILLVEQNVEIALKISDRAYILDQGIVVHEAEAVDMLADTTMTDKYCSV